MLRKWRKGKINQQKYIQKRKNYKIWCNDERKKHEKEEERKIRNICTDKEA